jgi:hypothetical protein
MATSFGATKKATSHFHLYSWTPKASQRTNLDDAAATGGMQGQADQNLIMSCSFLLKATSKYLPLLIHRIASADVANELLARWLGGHPPAFEPPVPLVSHRSKKRPLSVLFNRKCMVH